MTEEQAIERIARAIMDCSAYRYDANYGPHDAAQAAWSEIKAIAREEAKPLSAEMIQMIGREAIAQLEQRNPTIPNDSGTDWL